MESSSGADVLAERGQPYDIFDGVNRLILGGGKLGLASRFIAISYTRVNVNLRWVLINTDRLYQPLPAVALAIVMPFVLSLVCCLLSLSLSCHAVVI